MQVDCEVPVLEARHSSHKVKKSTSERARFTANTEKVDEGFPGTL